MEHPDYEGIGTQGNAAQVLVIGAGAAGLSTAGALKRLGIDAVALEQDSAIGGTWARRYDRLHLHTIRQLSGLAHLPMPRRYPRYVARDQFVQYLQGYAKRMGLRVITECKVKSVMPLEGATGSSWQVETEQGTWQSLVVVIATGQYNVPRLPSWPDQDTFAGRLIHSFDYRNGQAYSGKRALVIGVGNSGAEIATDLADAGASFVAVSIRTPPFLTRRDTYGMPVQLLSFVLSALPPRLADTLARGTMRLAFGNMSRFGIKSPGYSPYRDQRIPVIDVGFADAVKKGRVTVRPYVVAFTPTGVKYSNGQEEAFDLVVAATGFSSGLEQLLPMPGLLTGDYPLAPSGEETSRPGLYFIGFTHSLRGSLFEANRSSRLLAKRIAGYLKRLT